MDHDLAGLLSNNVKFSIPEIKCIMKHTFKTNSMFIKEIMKYKIQFNTFF
jgi:hypothetical protein